MADELDSSTAAANAELDGPEDGNPHRDTVGNRSTRQSRAERERADRTAFLAQWDADEAAGTTDVPSLPSKPKAEPATAKPADPKKPAVVAKPAEPELEDEDDEDVVGAGDDAEVDDDLDEDEDDELDAAAKDEDDDAAAGAKDPDVQKRLDQVRKYEQRSRQQLANERAAFERDRDAFIGQWKPKIEKAEAFDKIAKHDIVGILKAKGWTEDDFEFGSKVLYGLSPAAAADPKNKEAVARLQRERARDAELDELKSWRAAEEQRRTEQEANAAHAKRVDAYVGKVVKAVGDETPLLKKSMELAPEATRKRLEKLALRMAIAANSLDVDPKKVVRKFEKLRRTALERDKPLGELLAGAAGKQAPAAKKPGIEIEDRTRGGDGKKPPAAPAKPTNGKSLLPSRDEMIARLRVGNPED